MDDPATNPVFHHDISEVKCGVLVCEGSTLEILHGVHVPNGVFVRNNAVGVAAQ
jgi:hypothetical protein